MKNTILSLLMLFCITSAFSQELKPKIKWGREFDARKRSSLNDIVGWDDTGIYAIKSRNAFNPDSDLTLEHYDNNFLPTKSLDLDLKEDGRKCLVHDIIQLRGKLYIFTSLANNKTKKNILSVQKINKQTLQLEEQKIKVAEIDFTGESKSNSGGFSLRVSRDSSKVLVFLRKPYDKDEPEAFGFYVFVG